MGRSILNAAVLAAAILIPVAGSALLAQTTETVLGQLGLTETAARNFVMNEVRTPTAQRGSAIVLAGTRGFLKLPPAARGPAATALFAWAKSYVNSAPFKTAYATFRRDAVPEGQQQHALTIDEAVQKEVDDQLAVVAQMRQAAASMPPAEAAGILKSVDEQEAQIRSGEWKRLLRIGMEAERAEKGANADASASEANERYPADPQKIFARRLREFLDETADANFAAPTISLTGGPDGIEFAERSDQKRSWLWQEAVIAGREATTAARAAAVAWLKEIEP